MSLNWAHFQWCMNISSSSKNYPLLLYCKILFFSSWKYIQDYHRVLTEKIKWSISTQSSCQIYFLDWISNLSGELCDFLERAWVLCSWIFSNTDYRRLWVSRSRCETSPALTRLLEVKSSCLLQPKLFFLFQVADHSLDHKRGSVYRNKTNESEHVK